MSARGLRSYTSSARSLSHCVSKRCSDGLSTMVMLPESYLTFLTVGLRSPRCGSEDERSAQTRVRMLHMHDTNALLAAWESFYVIVGSSAAALTGLQFVVIALIAETARRSSSHEFAA